MASDDTNQNVQLGSNNTPAQRKREIPSGGLPIEEGIRQGIRAREDIFQKALENPELWYFDPETSRYKKRPEPSPDFSVKQQATSVNVAPASRMREISEGGLPVEEGIRQGIRAREDIFQKAQENPELWYFDPETSRYKKRPEPLPNFSVVGERRAIPCFPKGTLVATIDGLVPIELLTINTKVIAFDELRQAMLYKPIIALLLNKTARLVNVTIDRETICSTTCHRFWVENKKEWVAAKELKPGMLLQTITGGVSKIKKIEVQDVPEQNTYNLTIADCHTYFVGKQGVLVHNEDRRNGKVYIGRDTQGNIIYVGQTKQDILDREKNHHTDAIKKPEIYGYKKYMKLEIIIDGLTDDEMHYHERRVFEQLTAQGIKLRYEQEPMGHAGINKLIEKYC